MAFLFVAKSILNGMDIFFSLPEELRVLVLNFLEVQDLDRLFLLRSLVNGKPDQYIIVRHQALAARYAQQHLVMSNLAQFALFSLAELDYLIQHKIRISSRSVTFVIHATDHSMSEKYMNELWKGYLDELKGISDNFNVRLLLAEKMPLATSALERLFLPLCQCLLRVNWFTIKYSMGTEIHPSQEQNIIHQARTTNHSHTSLAMDNLKLHLFDSGNLLGHIFDPNGCFHCSSLRTLDLSFNNITDDNLRQIQFPASLEELNLLNNMICVLSSSTFRFSRLKRLKSINLSNNDIMRIELRESSDVGPFHLRKLDLSGNLLAQYDQLFRGKFFCNVEDLNLAHNLLEELTPFVSPIKKLNLCGNYFRFPSDVLADIIPKSLELLQISLPFVSGATSHDTARMFLESAQLPHLKELNFCICENSR